MSRDVLTVASCFELNRSRIVLVILRIIIEFIVLLFYLGFVIILELLLVIYARLRVIIVINFIINVIIL